jgi:transposase
VLTTNDDSLTPEDVALGYKSMMVIESCFRRMKTTGLRTRPMFHWTAHRVTAHVKLCVLALLLQRAAEIRCSDTWRNIYLQTTKVSTQMAGYLKKLMISTPKKILTIANCSRPATRA